MQFRTHKVIYRRYAGLFFSICVDITDNELAYLECIHLFVEILDHFFSNVCELDLVFNFHKVTDLSFSSLPCKILFVAQLWSLMLMVPLYVLNETCRWINQWTCLYSFCFTFFHDQNNTYVAFVVTLIRIASNSFTCLYSFSQMARKHLSEFSWLNTEHRCSFVNLGFMILAIEVQKLPILIFCSVYLEGLSDIRWIYSCRRAARNKQKGDNWANGWTGEAGLRMRGKRQLLMCATICTIICRCCAFNFDVHHFGFHLLTWSVAHAVTVVLRISRRC